MLTITKLKGAEYLIASVADGLEDYYMGAGEAPGVWRGSWTVELGLEGVVTADGLRALVDGLDPRSGVDLLAGHRERRVRAIDVTLSVPKSVSLLWAFASPETSTAVSIAVVEATEVALGFLEERAALARVREGGIRRRVATGGFAIATFAHRTSRAGDPQLHTHCLIPNVVRRVDGEHVAFDALPLHVWAKATGTVFLNELEALLAERLGVAWGPERNGCRELVGFSREQLRAFSKRTTAIETRLEAEGEVVFDSKAARMRADDRASLATRARKDRTLTPERLRQRWAAEAAAVGMEPGTGVDDLVVGRQLTRTVAPSEAELFAALVDPHTGLCASESRFGEAHVVERVAAMSAGRLSVDEIVELSRRFLGSGLVVRLAPDVARRRPAEWSTVELRAVEDHLLDQLRMLAHRPASSIEPALVDAAITSEHKPLGTDQAGAVRVLCGAGPSVRMLVAPAGFGKTTALHAAAWAATQAGRSVIALAPTHRATGELRTVGLDAQTVARFRHHLADTPLAPGTTLIVDEVSQVATRDAAVLLDAVAAAPGAQVWLVGDPRQAQPVSAGGLASELDRLAVDGVIPTVTLTVNRRQRDPAERQALAKLRAGEVEASQAIRAAHGWEHEHPTPADTRQALAQAALAAADRHGVEHVAVLAVSHADCEDLADRIRALRVARGELRGPTFTGPGWGPDPRVYAAGDRILVHINLGTGSQRRVHNGSTGTIHAVGHDTMSVRLDDGQQVTLDAAFVGGHRPDGTPNVSHAWARTVAGAQGGTWAQVHLLGTPTLDAFTGYVGQSRAQLPTHTWNTRPDPDHPASLLADERTAADMVRDAMRRDQPKTLAAVDDPWTLERELRAERDEHAAIVALRPPDGRAELGAAGRRLRAASDEHRGAAGGLDDAQHRRDRLGPLSRFRRGGSDDIARADERLAGARRRLERAEPALRDAQQHQSWLEARGAERAAWDAEHAWRLDRLATLDHRLDEHWAGVVLRAVHADDPLAFGVQRLRQARATHQGALDRIVHGLPPDRRLFHARAHDHLRDCRDDLRNAERNLARARVALDQARQRHWGRRDKTTIHHAEQALRAAQHHHDRRADAVTRAVELVHTERDAVRAWASATRDTMNERARLAAAVHDIDDALDRTRPDRVTAAAHDPTHELWHQLGPPPHTRGGRNAWCGIAEQLEAWRDHHDHADEAMSPTVEGPTRQVRETHRAAVLLSRSERLELRVPLDHADRIIRLAGALDTAPTRDAPGPPVDWQATVRTAEQILAVQPPTPTIERGLGLELEL